MAKIEVDEEEFVRNQKLRESIGKIWLDPKRRLRLEALHKEADPQAVTPELDSQAPVNDAISDIRKELAEFISESKKERQERERRETLDSLNSKISSGLADLKRQGWTDDGIKGVQEIMDKHGIVDPEVAASHYEKLHPPQAPITPGGSGSWNFLEPPADDEVDLKKLIETKGESTPLLDKMVRDTIAETRGQPARR